MVAGLLAQIRDYENRLREPGADTDAIRAQIAELQQELNRAMSGHTTSVTEPDAKLLDCCDTMLAACPESVRNSSVEVDYAYDIRAQLGTVFQQAIHDKLVKLYGPTMGADLVSETYRKITTGG